MSSNAAFILSSLYGLMMEINYHKADEEILSELRAKPDSFVEAQILRVKRTIVRNKAAANRHRVEQALKYLRELTKGGIEGLASVLKLEESEQAEFATLFRKFESVSKNDEESLLQDQQLLKLLERLQKNAGYDVP